MPSEVDPSKSSMATPASAVPVNVGVATLVMLSVELEPLSLPAVRSGVETLGAVVSIVTASVAVLVKLPAESVARAKTL